MGNRKQEGPQGVPGAGVTVIWEWVDQCWPPRESNISAHTGEVKKLAMQTGGESCQRSSLRGRDPSLTWALVGAIGGSPRPAALGIYIGTITARAIAKDTALWEQVLLRPSGLNAWLDPAKAQTFKILKDRCRALLLLNPAASLTPASLWAVAASAAWLL